MKQIHLHSSFIGPITALDTAAGSLTVMGQTILVDSLTHYAQANEDGSHTSLTLADFAVSDFVTVFGFFKSDDSFLATRVERAYAGADTTLCGISGTISGLDTTAMTFTVGSWTVSYASATVNGTLANDASVQVRGTVADTTLTATLVNVAKALGDPGCHGGLRGIVESLDTTALTFQVMGITVKYTTDIVVGTLANGVMVEVQGSFETDSTTVLDATRVVVTIKPSGRDDHRCDAQVKGAITALDLTAMTLTVADTTFWFDASTTLLSHDATITASDLAIGDWVAIVADSTKADANGCSYATRIVVIPSAPSDNEEPQQRLMGPVSSFDATAQTLVIDTFTVSVTTDTTYVSQGATITAETFWSSLAEGTMVEAIGSASSETAFTATKLILGCQDGMGRKRH